MIKFFSAPQDLNSIKHSAAQGRKKELEDLGIQNLREASNRYVGLDKRGRKGNFSFVNSMPEVRKAHAVYDTAYGGRINQKRLANKQADDERLLRKAIGASPLYIYTVAF